MITICKCESIKVISLPFILAEEYSKTYDKNGNLSSSQILEEFTWHPIEERILIKDVFYKGKKNYTVYYVTPEFIVTENKTGNYTEKFVYQDGNLVAQVNTNGQKQFLHNDHEGSSTLITDLNGNVVENSFYSPYGEIIDGGKNSRFDYTGKEFDSVTSDYDYNARKYRVEIISVF